MVIHEKSYRLQMAAKRKGMNMNLQNELDELHGLIESMGFENDVLEDRIAALEKAAVKKVRDAHASLDTLRKVIVYKWQLNEKGQHSKTEDGTALFHEWGLDCKIGSYSVAIAEREDGAVELIAADLIKFIK